MAMDEPRLADDAGLSVAAAAAAAAMEMAEGAVESQEVRDPRLPNLLELQYASSASESSSDTTISEEESEADTDSSAGEDDKGELEVERVHLVEEMRAAGVFEAEEGSDGEQVPRTKNEQLKLPPPNPIEFDISDSTEVILAGKVLSVVEGVVVVQGNPGSDVLDEGTVLVLEDRTKLGRVEEVFGPVTMPFYNFRYSEGDALPDKVCTGVSIYAVSQAASFVKPEELNSKGYDASGIHDEELPPEEVDYSDDEEEARQKRKAKAKRKGGEKPPAAQEFPPKRGPHPARPDRRPSHGPGRGRGGPTPTPRYADGPGYYPSGSGYMPQFQPTQHQQWYAQAPPPMPPVQPQGPGYPPHPHQQSAQDAYAAYYECLRAWSASTGMPMPRPPPGPPPPGQQ